MEDSIAKLRKGFHTIPDGKYLIGLSGGADSVAMLYLLLPDIRDGRIQAEAMHVNHGIRGSESDQDEDFVSALCDREKVPFYAARAELAGRTDEAAARAARFSLFRNRMAETGADGLLLAHNADDQAETFLMRLIRGSGPDGLDCMKAEDETAGIRIFRPMLELRRHEIREALSTGGIRWREDSTNSETRYFRNRVRQTILPEMDNMCPGTVERICRTTKLIAADNLLLDEQADELLRKSADGDRLLIGPVQCAPAALRNRVIRKWWRERAPEMKERSLSEDRTEELASLLFREKGKVNLPGGMTAVRGRRFLHMTGLVRIPVPPAEIRGTETRFGEYLLKESPSEGNPGDGRTAQEVPQGFTQGCEIRTRRPGDRIRPFGSAGSRKLQDYLTDRKIDEPFRDTIPLLCRGQEVLLVCGVGAGGIPEWNRDASVRLTWYGNMPWKE